MPEITTTNVTVEDRTRTQNRRNLENHWESESRFCKRHGLLFSASCVWPAHQIGAVIKPVGDRRTKESCHWKSLPGAARMEQHLFSCEILARVVLSMPLSCPTAASSSPRSLSCSYKALPSWLLRSIETVPSRNNAEPHSPYRSDRLRYQLSSAVGNFVGR